MAKYEVYKRDGRYEAVGYGWSALALLCPPLWAARHSLWNHFWTSVLVTLALLAAFWHLRGEATLPLIPWLFMGAVFGASANHWRRTNLKQRGYQHVASVTARSPYEAERKVVHGASRRHHKTARLRAAHEQSS